MCIRDSLYTGDMPDNGSFGDVLLGAGESRVVPYGFTKGGKVSVKTLAAMTAGATAVDNRVVSGYTYWKDGVLRTGNLTDVYKRQHVYDIPGRLKVTSEDIRVTNKEPAITGIKEPEQVTLEVKGDYLKITSDGEKIIEDGSAGLKVMGKMERTVWSDDYLVSDQGLYGTFQAEDVYKRQSKSCTICC